MSNLTLRVITALVLAATVLVVLFGFPGAPTLVFFAVLMLVGVWEWGGFLAGALWLRLGYVAGGLAAGLAISAADSSLAQLLLQASLFWWLLVALALYSWPVRYGRALVALTGYLCLLPAWLALLGVFTNADGARLFVWLVLIVAAADIGAYFSGKRFGRRKLAPELSPGKTLEGLAGGLLAATAMAAAGSALFGFAVWPALMWGPLVATVSVVGDLTVSAFKRNAGLKDSGRILPGHGGIMDRIDSLVAAAPVFVVILSFLQV